MSKVRFPRVPILALVALGLLWAAAAGLLLKTPGDPPFPDAETIDLRYSAQPGVNLERAELEPERLEPVLARLSQAGVTWIRFTLPWDEIESTQGQFDWAAWDAVAASFARFPDLHPIVVLDRSPVWARSESDVDNPLAPPRERSDFGAFGRAVAERYGAQFTYYQVWNEPNIAPHWGAKPVDPADYLGLLREAAVMLRALDPDARIIAAALAPTTEEGGANLSDLIFLDQLYRIGGRAWFDFPAVQPYGFSAGPDEPPGVGKLNFGRVWEARQIMLRHGDAGTPLWAASFGWKVAAEDGATSPWGGVAPGEQTAYTAAAYDKAASEWPWLGPMLWTARFPAERATGEVLSSAVAPPAILPPGSHRPDHPALHYSGGWRVTSSAADPSADGDTIDFTFRGTGLALRVQGGPYWAYLTASVDGGPANRLPRDESGASYLVLHDPSSAQRLVPMAAGLPFGEHSVRLIATGGWGQWALQGMVVSAAATHTTRVGLGLLASALLATIGAAAMFMRRAGRHAGGTPSGEQNARAFSKREARRFKPAIFRRLGSAGLGTAAPSEAAASAGSPGAPLWIAAIALITIFLVTRSTLVDFASLALLGLLFLICPGLAPPLIAASLPFWQRTEPVLRWQFGLFELLAWMGLAAWTARWILDALMKPVAHQEFALRLRWVSKTQQSSWLDMSVLALFASGLLATVFAAEQGVAWREFRIVFLFGLVFYWLITRTPSRSVRGVTGLLVTGLLAGATIASLIGLWQGVTGQGRVEVEGVGRIAALYGSPNNLALLLDRAVPLALALALFGTWSLDEGNSRRQRLWGLARRGALFAAFIVTLVANIATFSKGALLLGLPVGLGVVLLGGAWRSGRRWPVVILLGLALPAAIGLMLLFRTPRFAGLLNFEAGTSFLRLKLWRGALNMALDHPLLGVGPDNFLYAYRSRYVLPSGWQELNLSHPHNIILDLWTRLGLLGVVTGVAALLAAFSAGWRLFAARRQSGAVWPMVLGFLAGLAATLAHGLIDNSLFLPDLMGWFVAALGVFWLYSVQQEG